MSYYDQRQRPLLKNGVDIQLQSAFSEQNWATVIRLADKRAKASQDPYYEVCPLDVSLSHHVILVTLGLTREKPLGCQGLRRDQARWHRRQGGRGRDRRRLGPQWHGAA